MYYLPYCMLNTQNKKRRINMKHIVPRLKNVWLNISNAQTTRSSYSEWLHNYQIRILLETGSMHWSSRADKNHCLLLFRCSHIRPINMVKHQEVQLLWTHTFADKHLLKQCLNKDLTKYSYSPKKRKEIGCLCKSHYLKESFRHHILMTVINDEEMIIRKQKAAISINIKKARLAGKD